MKLTLEERIYGLSLIWREAKYNFARWDERPELDWDAEYQKALAKVIAIHDPYQYYRELQRFVCLLRDGHSYVVLPDELDPPYEAAFHTSYIDGKHLISGFPKGCGISRYSEITAVNDILLKEYLDLHILPYMWHEKLDNAFYFGALAHHIHTYEASTIKITTDSGSFSYTKGDDIEVDEAKDLWHSEHDTMSIVVKSDCVYIAITQDNIAYIDAHTFNNHALKDVLYSNIDKIKGCAGFIIDVRVNSGGGDDVGHYIAQLFSQYEYESGIWETPTYMAWHGAIGAGDIMGDDYTKIYTDLDITDADRKIIWEINKRKSFFKDKYKQQVIDAPVFLSQPVVILCGCGTASAAESFLYQMKNQNPATIVGGSTAGTNGMPYVGDLPGGGRFAICTMKCYTSDGVDYNNVGIQPDIFVENTIQNHIDGFDAVFDKGLSVLREQIKAKQ